MDKIILPPMASEALPILAEVLRETLQSHILQEGPPPGEYEQGFADGLTMAVMVIQEASNKYQGRP